MNKIIFAVAVLISLNSYAVSTNDLGVASIKRANQVQDIDQAFNRMVELYLKERHQITNRSELLSAISKKRNKFKNSADEQKFEELLATTHLYSSSYGVSQGYGMNEAYIRVTLYGGIECGSLQYSITLRADENSLSVIDANSQEIKQINYSICS